MIARVSRAKQGRLMPVCRFLYCRAPATRTWSRRDPTPFACEKHFEWANTLPSDEELRRRGEL